MTTRNGLAILALAGLVSLTGCAGESSSNGDQDAAPEAPSTAPATTQSSSTGLPVDLVNVAFEGRKDATASPRSA